MTNNEWWSDDVLRVRQIVSWTLISMSMLLFLGSVWGLESGVPMPFWPNGTMVLIGVVFGMVFFIVGDHSSYFDL